MLLVPYSRSVIRSVIKYFITLGFASIVCTWKNKTLPDGHRWKENGVDFFCTSEQQRVKPGCYLETGQIRCTGAFIGLLSIKLINYVLVNYT